MRALALAAVLLLALMPSMARLLAARTSAGAHAGWVELCTMAGLKLVKLDPATPAAPDHGGDCSYCPLLHSLAAPTAAPLMALASPPPLPPPALGAPQRHPLAAQIGLGSRGPPSLA